MLPWQIFIQIDNDSCYITEPVAPNELVKPSDVRELIPLLEKYIGEHTDKEIEEENKRRWDICREGYKNKPETYASGYVYLFECGGKYKIGVSNDVNRRIKDLDHRPFKVTLISKVHSKMAYKVEGTIHALLKKHKIEGEWYDFPTTPTAEWFESLVKRVEDDIRRTKYD